ncbi:MAG: hypothetical protein K0S71_2394 [Clostridia bacterium]|jgi:raffinose/stachyose/melibiose transport system substrate-binding protein|nr:hypothetical protein [Clostridia bacterium]
MKSRVTIIIFVLYIIGTLIIYNIFIDKAEQELNKSFTLGNRGIQNLYLIGWEYFPQEIINKFNKEYPYIRINFEKAEKDNYSSLLKARIASKVQVDIMSIIPRDYKDFVNKGYLLDLSDEEYLNNYTSKARDYVKKLDPLEKEYAVCYKSYVYGIWYNKTLFERNGVEAPKNYYEFLKVCERLKSKDIAPLALGVRDNRHSSYIYLLRLPKLSEIQGTWTSGFKGISIDFENIATQNIMQDIEELVNKDNLMMDSKYLTYYQAFHEFAKGKAAMIIMDDSSLSLVDSDMEKIMDPGVFAIPYQDSGITERVPRNDLGLMMGVFANSEHREEAKIFLEYLSRPDIAQMYCDSMLFPPNIQGVNPSNIKYNKLWEPLRNMPGVIMSIDNLEPRALEQLQMQSKLIITQD